MLLKSRLCASAGVSAHARSCLPIVVADPRGRRRERERERAERGASHSKASPSTRGAVCREGVALPVATAESVDGLQEVRRDQHWSHARREQLKHDSGGSGNSEGGRQGGVGGKTVGGKRMVNDPLTQLGVGGGKPLSAQQLWGHRAILYPQIRRKTQKEDAAQAYPEPRNDPAPRRTGAAPVGRRHRQRYRSLFN